MDIEKEIDLPYVFADMPLVMVRNGLRAAIGRDNDSEGATEFVNKLTRVEIHFAHDHQLFANNCTVSLWWDLGKGQSYVYQWKLQTDNNSTGEAIAMRDFWESVSEFSAEDILTLRARVA